MRNYVHWKTRAASLKSTIFESREPFFFLERKKTLPYAYVIGGGRSVPFYFVRPPHRSRRKIEQPPGAQCRRG